MKNFKTIFRVLFPVVMLSALIISGCASTDKPGAILVEEVSKSATVTNIDLAKRVVTLKAEDGSVNSYVVTDAVKNLDQLKVGDIIRATAVESVALYVRKSNEQPDAKASESVKVAPKGDKPGITITDTFEVSAKVMGIDLNKGVIAMKLADGSIKSFGIDKANKDFKNVKVGDEVVLNVTAAVMISVEAPAAAK